MNLDNKSQGFTLTEVLIVLGASAIIGTMLVTLMIQGSDAIFNQNIQVNQNLALNNASSLINEIIKSASSIEETYSSEQNQYITNSSTLIIKTPSVDLQGGVIDNKFDVIIIAKDHLNNEILKKYIFADPLSSRKNTSQVVLTNLSLIQFTYLNSNQTPVLPASASRIDYILKTAEKSGLGVKESSFSGRINLKNL